MFHWVKVEVWWNSTKIDTERKLFRAKIITELICYFSSYNVGEAWETDPANLANGGSGSFASTTSGSDVELLDGNSCPEGSGMITKVEIRTRGYYEEDSADIILRPIFSAGDGNNHIFYVASMPCWSPWFDITTDTNAPDPWSWDDVEGLDCDVEVDGSGSFTVYCSKVDIRVTYYA